jgi:adenylosuccinate lyase
MRLRENLIQILGETNSLQAALLRKASKSVEVLMPGFTHLQHAQPVTVAHHLLAYFDMFGRDFERLTPLTLPPSSRSNFKSTLSVMFSFELKAFLHTPHPISPIHSG